MKKFLFAIAAILMSVPSFAQLNRGTSDLSASSLYYGARLGVAFSTLTGDVDLGSRTGLTLGGVVGMELTDKIFIESGLYYSERGAKKSGQSYAKYNTFEIPLIIKYGFEKDEVAFLPFLGIVFSHAVTGKSKHEYTNDEAVGSFDEKKNDWALLRNNMGIKFGCGLEYKVLYAELAYQIGITNVLKDEGKVGLINEEGISSHSNALLFNIGVNF